MNEKVTQMVALLFRDVQVSEEVQALHDEVLNNCQDRFADLTRNGLGEEEALAAVMESLKGMEDVLKEYPQKEAAPVLEAEEAAKDPESQPLPPKEPIFTHLDPEKIKAIDANLTSCEVEVLPHEGDFILETRGPVYSHLEPDGTLRIWQERASENLFKGISWDKSFDSFGDAMSKLGQNLSQLVNRSLNINREAGSLDIEVVEKRAVLRIPADLHPDVRIRTTSGAITWKDVLPGRSFQLGCTSGDIQVDIDDSFLLPRVEVSTTSGDAELRLSAEEVFINTVSGDLTWEGDAGVLEMNSTSGDVEVTGRVPELHMNSTSGDLRLKLTKEEDTHITMNTVSGDVEIRLPMGVQEISAELNTRSGSLRTRGLDLVEVAPIRVEANSLSGDLKILY